MFASRIVWACIFGTDSKYLDLHECTLACSETTTGA